MDHLILIYIVKIRPFLAHLYKSTKTYCCHFDVGIGTGVTLVDKRLSGELSSTETGFVVASTLSADIYISLILQT